MHQCTSGEINKYLVIIYTLAYRVHHILKHKNLFLIVILRMIVRIGDELESSIINSNHEV